MITKTANPPFAASESREVCDRVEVLALLFGGCGDGYIAWELSGLLDGSCVIVTDSVNINAGRWCSVPVGCLDISVVGDGA